MFPNFLGIEFQTFIEQCIVRYPSVDGVLQDDVYRLGRVFNGSASDAGSRWLSLVAVGRMQGIAITIGYPEMVTFLADVAIMLVRGLYELDTSVRAV